MSIKLIVCAFEGVITDGRITVDSTGVRQPISYHYKDAMAIRHLQKSGVQVGVITSCADAFGGAVGAVVRQMGFDMIYIGEESKHTVLTRWLSQLGIGWDEVAYLGSAIDDYNCMEGAYISAVPENCSGLSSVTDFVCPKSGGEGVLSEFADYLDL